jgi:hypothetical protein
MRAFDLAHPEMRSFADPPCRDYNAGTVSLRDVRAYESRSSVPGGAFLASLFVRARS